MDSVASYVDGIGIVVATAQRVGEVISVLVVGDHGADAEALIHHHTTINRVFVCALVI